MLSGQAGVAGSTGGVFGRRHQRRILIVGAVTGTVCTGFRRSRAIGLVVFGAARGFRGDSVGHDGRTSNTRMLGHPRRAGMH